MPKRGRQSEAANLLDDRALAELLFWVCMHISDPYPDGQQKKEMERTTGLDPQQIRNWLSNFRKRHWKPVIDQGRAPRSEMEMQLAMVADTLGVPRGLNTRGGGQQRSATTRARSVVAAAAAAPLAAPTPMPAFPPHAPTH